MNKEARIKQLFGQLPVQEDVTIHAFKKYLTLGPYSSLINLPRVEKRLKNG
jgi:hypothetical protein